MSAAGARAVVERALTDALLRSPEQIRLLVGWLDEHDFADPAERATFVRMLRVHTDPGNR